MEDYERSPFPAFTFVHVQTHKPQRRKQQHKYEIKNHTTPTPTSTSPNLPSTLPTNSHRCRRRPQSTTHRLPTTSNPAQTHQKHLKMQAVAPTIKHWQCHYCQTKVSVRFTACGKCGHPRCQDTTAYNGPCKDYDAAGNLLTPGHGFRDAVE